MKWFARRRGGPQWHADLSSEDWADGARCLQRALYELGSGGYTDWRRTGRIRVAGHFRRRVDIYVGPLLSGTCDPDPRVWVKSIRRELVFQAGRAPRLLRAGNEEERLRPLLLPLLVTPLEGRDLSGVLVRQWSDGVVALLCARAPEGTRAVARSEATAIGVDPEVLWDDALDHVRAEPVELRTAEVGAPGPAITYATGDGGFGMGHLLRLRELVAGPAPHGVLVGILTSPGLFVFHTVVRRLWAQAMVETFRKLGPDGVEDSSFTGIVGVHWWKDGPQEAVRVATSTETSPRLAELLASVPE